MYDRRQNSFQHADPQSGKRVDAKVKWFNATKGFGFVTPSDGVQDAFLPMAILRRAGYEDVREGASLVCEIGEGPKGPLVISVLNVDNSTATQIAERHGSVMSDRPRASSTLEGAVKWFEPVKGYGFIAPDNGGKDIFVHVTAIRRSGLNSLDPGMRVRVDVIDGKKGLEADRLTVI